jgi:hypothetical protein
MAFAPCPSTLEKLQGMVAFVLFLSHAADQASVQAAHYIYIYFLKTSCLPLMPCELIIFMNTTQHMACGLPGEEKSDLAEYPFQNPD